MAKDPICGMTVNEKTGLSLSRGGQTHFFCSRNCLEKFAQQFNIPNEEVQSCLVSSSPPFYKNKTFIVAAVLVGLSAVSYFFPVLVPFRVSLLKYLKTIWWAILLGLILGGIMDYYIPREYISHILAKPKKRTIFYSVILGFFMSACSHGILALSMELHKKGASNPAVVSFLLASPWSNLIMGGTWMDWSFLGRLLISAPSDLVPWNSLASWALLDFKKSIKA